MRVLFPATVDLINQGTTFTAVASFTAGGLFFATGSNDRVNPVSPLYGSWQRIRRHRFSSTTYFFAFDPANPNGAELSRTAAAPGSRSPTYLLRNLA
jgi:hypothetical protein